MKLLFIKRVPVYFLIIAALIGAVISYSFTSISSKTTTDAKADVVTKPESVDFSSCSYTISRLGGRRFIKPLLFAEKMCETDKFSAAKISVDNLITNLKAKGDIKSASVYIRLFNRGEWFAINGDNKYQPGSLFKVPLLMTYLRISENKPDFLEKKFVFNAVTQESKSLKQEFVKNAIKVGNSYTIRELLTYMIVHSDNNATMLLMNNIPFTEFERTFTDLGMSKELTKNEAVISAKEYAAFWITLYNGSYLNFDNSEFALSLLSKTDFTEGIIKGLPQNTKVAHKFGEKGDATNHAFHETGIVYVNNYPYLISVMTEGNDQAKLPKVLQEISSAVYSNIEAYTH